LFHWTVVSGCVINLLREDGDSVHRWVGYVVAAAVAIRLIWGFVGRGHARFSAFVPRPANLYHYLAQLVRGREPRYLGHNPAGAVMMLALIGLLIAVSTTGWMMGLDRWWGNETLQEVHEWCAEAILYLAAIHVFAAIVESLRHRENLIASMVSGRKRKPSGTDIDHAADPG
jgi:cytochrome b